MEIYLFTGDGMDTGESFRSWDEVFAWVRERIGCSPSDSTRFAITHGRHFDVGSRSFLCVVSEESASAVA